MQNWFSCLHVTKESKQKQRYVDELFDKLNKAQDELNNIRIICIILEVTIPIKEQNGNIIEENNMIRISLLENSDFYSLYF